MVPVGTDNADQFTARFDHKINDRQSFTAYYYLNDGRQLQPYDNFEEAGANVPGFGNYLNLRNQQWNLTHTWTISNALVNEAHFTYMREGELGYLKSQTTNAVTSSCTGAAAAFCFTGLSDSAAITSEFGAEANLGITPGLPQISPAFRSSAFRAARRSVTISRASCLRWEIVFSGPTA